MGTDLKLPDLFDVIVCGTGLTESMVAACLSRVGKKVLHIDRNDYYGGPWATFTFESLIKWIQKYEQPEQSLDEELPIREADEVPSSDVCIRNVVIRSYIPDKNTKDIEILNGHIHEHKNVVKNDSRNSHNSCLNDDIHENIRDSNSERLKRDDNNVEGNDSILKEDNDQNTSTTTEATNSTINDELVNKPNKSKLPLSMISQARIRQNFDDISLDDFLILSRKFNLDITTKFLFSAGPLVNAIIKANISHYAEFKVVNRILTWKDDLIIEVPCNRSDVFGSTFLTMIEKRVLMKFLTSCLDSPTEESEEIKLFNGKPFKEFLESRKLNENLQKFIIYSIALVKPDTPTELAMIETSKFLKSLGRYGKSPFIWPLYGIGELPQAFCRMSAVFGGTYCLNLNIETIEFDENRKVKTCIDGQKIESDHIIMDNSYVPYRFDAHVSDKMISKGILITNQSLLPTAEEHLSFLTIPPLLGHEESVRVIEIGPASSACPSGLFVLYLMCASSYSTAEEDLLQYTTLLTAHNEEGSNKPKLLWSLYFNQLEDIIFDNIPENAFIPSMPDSSLGFELAVEEAKKIFHSICPDEEFMLAVPNSEDIIWGTTESEEKSEKVDSTNKDSLNLEKTIGDNTSFQEKVDDNIKEKDEKTLDKDASLQSRVDDSLLKDKSLLNDKDCLTIDETVVGNPTIDNVNNTDNRNIDRTIDSDVSLENGIDHSLNGNDITLGKTTGKDTSFENGVDDDHLNDSDEKPLDNSNDENVHTLEKTVEKDMSFLEKVDNIVMKVDQPEVTQLNSL